MKISALTPFNFNPDIKLSEPLQNTSPSLANWFSEQLKETNQQLQAADNSLQQLASGEAKSLHQTMLTLEQAKLSFQFLEQVRNRLMTAYQEILREQI